MAKQVITITIDDAENENNQNGVDCHLHIDAEHEAGSHSYLMAVAIKEQFRTIMDVTAEYIQNQQDQKSNSAISITGSIH